MAKPNWITVNPGSGSAGDVPVSISLQENQTLSARSGDVTITSSKDSGVKKVLSVSQAAGYYSYAEPQVTVSWPVIPAAGGSVTPTVSYSQTYGWNGRTSGVGTVTTGAEVTYSGSGVNASTGSVSASGKGTTESAETLVVTASVTVKLNGKTKTVSYDVKQAANTYTYGAVTISGGSFGTFGDVYANGSNIPTSVRYASATQVRNWTSGSKDSVNVSVEGATYSTAWENNMAPARLGSTVKDRTKVGTMTMTVKGNSNISGSKSYDIYQEKNALLHEEDDVPYMVWGIPDQDPDTTYRFPAAEGSQAFTAYSYATHYKTYTSDYRDGAPFDEQNSNNGDMSKRRSSRIEGTMSITFSKTGEFSDWASLDSSTVNGSSNIKIAYRKNSSAESRDGYKLTFSFNVNGTAGTYVTALSQAASPVSLSVNPINLSFDATGGSKTVTVSSNADWTIS